MTSDNETKPRECQSYKAECEVLAKLCGELGIDCSTSYDNKDLRRLIAKSYAKLREENESLKKLLGQPGEGNRYRLMLMKNDQLTSSLYELQEENKILRSKESQFESILLETTKTHEEIYYKFKHSILLNIELLKKIERLTNEQKISRLKVG